MEPLNMDIIIVPMLYLLMMVPITQWIFTTTFLCFAQTTLDTMKEILEDLDMVQKALGEQCNSKRIVTLIKNTMSDRHAAEKLFN